MSADMIGGLVNSFGGPVIEQLGAKLGLPPATVKQFTPIVVGLVVVGIGRMLKKPNGAAQLNQMVSDAGAQVGGQDLASFLGNYDPANSKAMLTVLAGGNSIDNVVNNLSGKTGIPAEAMTGMLGAVAPAILSQLGAIGKEQGLDAQGMADLVQKNLANIPDSGALDYILDNTPGISDDISRGLKKLFGS